MSLPAHVISPARYMAANAALSELPTLVDGFGGQAAIIHGQHGLAAVEATVGPLLPSARRVRHEGYCTPVSVRQAALAVQGTGADVVVGVGGGRVLDVAKAVADALDLTVVTVPTSPATCAAMTALTVYYDEQGRWSHGCTLRTAPQAAVLDLAVLTRAPLRLLASGLLDATAKSHEVRMALKRAVEPGAAANAAGRLCEQVDNEIRLHVAAAFGRPNLSARPPALATLCELAIALPGWIGGLAGEANKLAAAHAVHNALTTMRGSKASMHGELVGFGVVVQEILRAADAREIVDLTWRLRAPAGLEALGCSAYFHNHTVRSAVHNKVLRAPTVTRAFPDLTERQLAEAIAAADAMLIEHSSKGRQD